MEAERPRPWQPLRWTVTPDAPQVTPLALRFDLPFCIYLPDLTYDVLMGTGIVQVHLEKRWREGFTGAPDAEPGDTVQYAEEGAMMSEDIGGSFPPAEGGKDVEFDEDPTGRVRYTQCTVAVSVPSGSSTDVSDVLEEYALPVVNRIVEVYRDVAGRDYLPAVHLHDIDFVAMLHPITGEQEFSRLFERRPLRLAIVSEPSDVIARVSDLLKSGEPIPMHRTLLADVRRDFEDGRHRQAVVGVVTALEALVSNVLRANLDVPSEEIDDLIDRTRIGDLMKKPMEDGIAWRPSSDAQLWQDWLGANETRRGVVHRGEQISGDQAQKAIGAVKMLMDAIEEHAAAG